MRLKYSNLLGLILTLAIAALFSASHAQSEQTAPVSDETDVSWLYVVNATGGTFDGKTITMHDVPPALMFSDRPNRIWRHMTLSELLPLAKEGPDNFIVNPPKAVLSTFRDGDPPTEATVIMHDATIDGAHRLFSVSVLDGSIPARFGPASLFVDSHHGHHAAGAFIVGAAVGHAATENNTETVVVREPTYVYNTDPIPVVSAPATAQSRLAQSRFAEAQRLFDQGLITKDEYARKREQILASM